MPDQGNGERGHVVATRCAAFFIFEGDRLVCERDYFDSLTIMSRLGLSEPVSGAA